MSRHCVLRFTTMNQSCLNVEMDASSHSTQQHLTALFVCRDCIAEAMRPLIICLLLHSLHCPNPRCLLHLFHLVPPCPSIAPTTIYRENHSISHPQTSPESRVQKCPLHSLFHAPVLLQNPLVQPVDHREPPVRRQERRCGQCCDHGGGTGRGDD